VADELFKADFAVVITVQIAEEVVHKLARFTMGEEPPLEVVELLLVKFSVWVVSHELFVPVWG